MTKKGYSISFSRYLSSNYSEQIIEVAEMFSKKKDFFIKNFISEMALESSASGCENLLYLTVTKSQKTKK